MGIFKTIFGEKSQSNTPDFWVELQTITDLEKAISVSNQQKVAIFKHSTRCGISTRVKAKFEKEIQEKQPQIAFYYLDLLAHRDISNYIAEYFNITHQSPQIIVIENGKAIQNASHSDISLDNI
jgi:bacillithiol system protein YtxJ